MSRREDREKLIDILGRIAVRLEDRPESQDLREVVMKAIYTCQRSRKRVVMNRCLPPSITALYQRPPSVEDPTTAVRFYPRSA